MLYGRLLDNNSYRCEALTDLSYPVVLLQGSQGSGDGFIESLRGDLYGVLNVSKIPDRDYAGSKSHVQERSIFVFCSPRRSNRDRLPSDFPILIFAVRADSVLYRDYHH
jgi:hypothetical protein